MIQIGLRIWLVDGPNDSVTYYLDGQPIACSVLLDVCQANSLNLRRKNVQLIPAGEVCSQTLSFAVELAIHGFAVTVVDFTKQERTKFTLLDGGIVKRAVEPMPPDGELVN